MRPNPRPGKVCPQQRLSENPRQRLQAREVKPAATEGYRTAEVTLGGIDARNLSSKTMESKVPGLFFIGEVADVTGDLGRFDCRWVWSSGQACALAW